MTKASQKELIETEKSIVIRAGESVYFSMAAGYNLYEIKTISARADTEEGMTVSIYADNKYKEEIYRSLKQTVTEDLVCIPVRDKSGGKLIYIGVNNPAATELNATVKIKAVSL